MMAQHHRNQVQVAVQVSPYLLESFSFISAAGQNVLFVFTTTVVATLTLTLSYPICLLLFRFFEQPIYRGISVEK